MNKSQTTQPVDQTDFNRSLSTRFAPSNKRHGLLLLCAFDAELANIPNQTSEPLLQRIRTQFLRDALYENEGAGHWLVKELIKTFQCNQALFTDLKDLIEVHEASQELEAAPATRWDSYCQRQSVLFKLAYSYLQDRPEQGKTSLFRQCGVAYGGSLILCANRGQLGDKCQELEQFQQTALAAYAGVKSELQAVAPIARAAILPLALVPPYLHLFQGSDIADSQPIDLHPARKAWILWRAARNGFK